MQTLQLAQFQTTRLGSPKAEQVGSWNASGLAKLSDGDGRTAIANDAENPKLAFGDQ